MTDKLQTRYRLGDVIASGGMAEVYRAHDEFLGRDVAVKVFHATAATELDFKRQEDEVNVLARLNHPNLVTLLDAAVDRSDPEATRIFYVMELVEGTDLKRRLDEGPLVARQVAQIGYYTATALEYVHGQGIVHRDVKPANIFITFNDDGTRVTAKLGDFGVASIGPAEPIADDEIVTGTVAYLSPEQARGEEVGAASDVYALGLVLLQCFTGELAFPGPAQHSAMARLLDDPPLTDAVPEEWVPLLRAMTSREVRERPDIHDVALALRQMFAAETGRHKAPAQLPQHEPHSQSAARYGLADAAPDGALDRITALAARVLRAPVAIVSVVDEGSVWFTSLEGIDVARVAHDLGAATELGLQFSAGVPLITDDGYKLGTLCVLDFEPRSISDDELATLSDLAAMVVRELELRRDTRDLQAREPSLMDAPDIDDDGTIITNRATTGPIEVLATQ